MSTIEGLEPGQADLLPAYRDRWEALGLRTGAADRGRAEEAIACIYRSARLPAPVVVWTPSPLGSAMERAWTTPFAAGTLCRDRVRDQAWEIAWRAVTARVGRDAWSTVQTALWARLRRPILDLVRDPIQEALVGHHGPAWPARAGAFPASRGGADGAVARSDPREDPVADAALDSGYGPHDAWLATYDFFREACGIEAETAPVDGLVRLARSGGWWLPHEKVCWVSPPPVEIHRDTEGRLHREGGPALVYEDWEIHAWHGTLIPAAWGGTRSENWNPGWLLETSDTGLRRALLQALGYERVMSRCGSRLVHREGEMEIRRVEGVDVEPIQLLKVRCPSTGLEHLLRVPPQIDRCAEARGWTFGDEPLSFVRET